MMFEGVVNTHLLERAARRSAYSLGATALQSFIITGLVVVTAQMAARPKPMPAVEVQFIRAVAPRPPPPPAAAPATAARPAAVAAARARGVPVVSMKPRAPTALIQPREVAPEMKAPDANEPIEDYGDAGAGTGEGGVIGGIPGYVPESAPGSSSEATNVAFTRAEQTIEDAPQYATRGFRPPQEAEAGCVRAAIRMPPSLAGYVSGPVVVKFAVGRAGAIGEVQFMSPLADPRLGEVIKQALRACRWLPGSDAQGRPTALWVVMPFRFEAG